MNYEYVILRKPVLESTDIHEWVEINGRVFDGHIGLGNRFGLSSSIGGGRITELLLTEADNVIAYYKNGQWEIPVPDLDAEAYLAVVYFEHRYNRVISENEERGYFVHGNCN
jgi:hypothetical protein